MEKIGQIAAPDISKRITEHMKKPLPAKSRFQGIFEEKCRELSGKAPNAYRIEER